MALKEKIYTINSLAAELDMSQQYIRKMVRSDRIKTTMVQVGDTKISRHEMTAKDVELWLSSRKSSFKRSDGRNKFVIYLTPGEYGDLRGNIIDFGADGKELASIDFANNIDQLFHRANKKSS